MLLRVVTLFSLALSFLLVSCSPKHSEIVLAEFGDQEVTMGEFENMYAKNAGGYEKAKEDSLHKLQNFLDLYVNFRMKLRDAKVRGYDTNQEVNDELLDYKKKVGVSFILEKQLVEPGIKELYDRRKTELRVSHIMIRPDSTGDEGARKLAQQLLDSIKAGKDFAEMVSKYTDDIYSKNSGGDVYYITAGMLPPSFEDAAFETAVGQIYPEPVKTSFGYHIVKVTDRRDRVPEIRASHILVDFNNAEGENDSAAARLRVDSVKTMIDNGADFAELAKTYSEDTGSKMNGGDLGFFQRRMMVKEFDEAAFNLETGEVSDIVRTNYGYHIIKVNEKKEYPSLEENKEELKNIYKQTRYQEDHTNLVNELKKKYNFDLNQSSLDVAAARTDTLKVGDDLTEAVNGIGDQPVFSYNGKTVTTAEFLKRAMESPDNKNKVANRNFYYEAVDKIGGDYLLEEEALGLEKTNPDFAQLMDDYRNGIYIFKLQDEEVWSRVKTDSVRLREYYEQNKENYRWPDRVNFSEIFTRKDSLAKAYYAQLQEGADFEEMAANYTERPGFKEKAGNYGLSDPKTNKLAEEAAKLEPGKISEPYANGGGFSILKLNFVEPARIKTFTEAKAEVAGAFQEYESKRIEQEYLEKLRNRYKPEVYYEKLEEAYKAEK